MAVLISITSIVGALWVSLKTLFHVNGYFTKSTCFYFSKAPLAGGGEVKCP